MDLVDMISMKVPRNSWILHGDITSWNLHGSMMGSWNIHEFLAK